MVRAWARVGLPWGLGLRGSVTVDVSWADNLLVVEWGLQGGAGWRKHLPWKLSVEASLLLGVTQHLFEADRGSPDSGNRWDFLGTLALELRWHPASWAAIMVLVAPGLTEESREHVLDGAVVWERSWFRLETGLGLALTL